MYLFAFDNICIQSHSVLHYVVPPFLPVVTTLFYHSHTVSAFQITFKGRHDFDTQFVVLRY